MDVKKSGHPPIPLLRDEIDHRAAGRAGNPHPALHARGPVVHPEPASVSAGRQPFFLYLAYTFPHIPLHASKAFRGKSPRGLYGDVVEEIDWSVGQILAALRDEGLAESTLVVFTSDNGPWLIQQLQGGSAGLLREGKGSTWEGGVRVPCLAWWPGTIAPGAPRSTWPASSTCSQPAWIWQAQRFLKTGRSTVSRWRRCCEAQARAHALHLFYYHGAELFAVRRGPWKLHLKTIDPASGQEKAQVHDPPLLFHLTIDPSERLNVADRHPDVIEQLLKDIEKHRQDVKPGKPSADADASS